MPHFHRPFGPLHARVPAIGQGTWNLEHADKAQALATLERGCELGLTHVDTAELYGDGEVERLIAPFVKKHRDELFLVSKVHPKNASREGTVKACERSLKRLGTDHLDVYLLHWESQFPIEETLAAFEALVEAGKIRAYGLSNFDVQPLEEAIGVVGTGKIVCNQVLYHLEERAIEAELLPFCRKQGIALVGYSPFGSGRFVSPRSVAGKTLAKVAERVGATARQVALAFLTRDKDLFAIPKASSVAHVEENAGARAVRLSAQDLSELDRAFPVGPSRGLPFL